MVEYILVLQDTPFHKKGDLLNKQEFAKYYTFIYENTSDLNSLNIEYKNWFEYIEMYKNIDLEGTVFSLDENESNPTYTTIKNSMVFRHSLLEIKEKIKENRATITKVIAIYELLPF